MENSGFKIALTVLWSLVGIFQPKAQNLVPNPSFEEYSDCPTTEGQLQNAIGWLNPIPTSQASPDYYNSCNCQYTNVFNLCVPNSTIGYQQAHSGVAYAGIYTFSYLVSNAREYLQIKLSDTLVKKRKYIVGFYCSLRDDLCNLATNNWGAFLSRDAISKNTFLIDTIPQLVNGFDNPLTSKTEWMLVSDTIEAEGGEAYITIGNFFQDSLTDTVSVYLEINGQPSTYWGYKQPYYLIDDVFVIPLDSLTGIKESKQLNGKAFVANGRLLVELKENYKPISIVLSTATGQTVWQHNEFYSQGQVQYSLPPLAGGLYFVEVRCGGGVMRQKVFITDY